MNGRREIPILSVLPAKLFHSCVLTTYSFDFNYFNHDALAGLSRTGVKNICVFVDDSMFQHYLGSLTGYAARGAKRYSLSSIVRQGAFHPKISMFFGRNGHGFLIIGSGNLTAAGHGNNQELWGAFHIDGPNDPKSALFKQAWDYVKSISNEVQGMSKRKVEWIETHTPWMQDIPHYTGTIGFDIGNNVEAFLLTNSGNGIFQDMQDIVRDDVLECTVVSPFFDNNAELLFELERSYPNALIHTIVQPESFVGDFSGKNFARVRFYDWNALEKGNQRRYLHAKLIHIQTVAAEYCIFGSANLSLPAFGTTRIPPSNEEVCLLLKRDEGSWLEEIGLNNKGPVISIPNQINKITVNKISREPLKFRLQAIDRLGTNLYLYMKKNETLQDAILVLFDGWGEEQNRVELRDSKYLEDAFCYKVTVERLSEDVFYGQLFDQMEKEISNKQIIHDMVALSRTNPDPVTQRLEEVLDRIEFADSEMIEILNYLDPEDLSVEKNKRNAKQEKEDDKFSANSNGSGKVLSYEEFSKISLEHQNCRDISMLYGTHRIERILETLKIIFEKLKLRDVDIASLDEESDKESLESSTGRVDEKSQERHVLPASPSAFANLKKAVLKFFNQYIAILEKQRLKERLVDVLDASMFAISLHLLLDFLDKPILIRKKVDGKEYEEVLMKAEGEYFEKEDYCRILTEIIGKFTTLLINGINDANDEYVRRRIEKCRNIAYWHAVCCIARLVPLKFSIDYLSDNSFIWKWEMAMNMRYYYSPDNASNEINAREEIEHRVQMMHSINEKDLLSSILNTWKTNENTFKKYKNIIENKPYKKGSRVFCKYTGFSHLTCVEPFARKHKVGIARVGYPPNKDVDWDFKEVNRFPEGRKYIAEVAKIKVLEE